MNKFAPLLLDGYKLGHRFQYPENTRVVFSNLTPRGTRIEGIDKVNFFGLQYFLKEYVIKAWNDSFFSQPVDTVCAEYSRYVKAYLGEAPCDKHLRDLHKLGFLPLEFWALPEGRAVPLRVPMYVVYNTRPDVLSDGVFAWLTNNIETIASTSIWMPCTSATTALSYRRLFEKWAAKTNPEMSGFVPWQGHDFSFRGHSSYESAVLSGAGHALFFNGSDTVPVMPFFERYYNANVDNELIIGSVNATEHSVACMGSTYSIDGKPDDYAYFVRMIDEVHPTGILSLVSDTFDFWRVVNPDDGILVRLKEMIMNRNGKVVIRPDSGDPVKIVTGYTVDEIGVDDDGTYFDLVTRRSLSDVEVKGLVQCLYDIFGGTTTSTGYLQLDEHIGAIYGDSITLARAVQICERLEQKGFASTNLVYGIGSYTYQYVTRDTFGFAVKSTYGENIDENGNLVGVEIFKDPATDDGLKKSARGLTAVYEAEGEYVLKDQATWDEVRDCSFVKVFSNGLLTKDWSLAEVRENAAKSI